MARNAVPETLTKAFDAAVAGDTRALYDVLSRGSWLPGPRINETLVEHFADDARVRGARADRVVTTLATLDADSAPGATPLEFLPVCGIAALAARASVD